MRLKNKLIKDRKVVHDKEKKLQYSFHFSLYGVSTASSTGSVTACNKDEQSHTIHFWI